MGLERVAILRPTLGQPVMVQIARQAFADVHRADRRQMQPMRPKTIRDNNLDLLGNQSVAACH